MSSTNQRQELNAILQEAVNAGSTAASNNNLVSQAVSNVEKLCADLSAITEQTIGSINDAKSLSLSATDLTIVEKHSVDRFVSILDSAVEFVRPTKNEEQDKSQKTQKVKKDKKDKSANQQAKLEDGADITKVIDNLDKDSSIKDESLQSAQSEQSKLNEQVEIDNFKEEEIILENVEQTLEVKDDLQTQEANESI